MSHRTLKLLVKYTRLGDEHQYGSEQATHALFVDVVMEEKLGGSMLTNRTLICGINMTKFRFLTRMACFEPYGSCLQSLVG